VSSETIRSPAARALRLTSAPAAASPLPAIRLSERRFDFNFTVRTSTVAGRVVVALDRKRPVRTLKASVAPPRPPTRRGVPDADAADAHRLDATTAAAHSRPTILIAATEKVNARATAAFLVRAPKSYCLETCWSHYDAAAAPTLLDGWEIDACTVL